MKSCQTKNHPKTHVSYPVFLKSPAFPANFCASLCVRQNTPNRWACAAPSSPEHWWVVYQATKSSSNLLRFRYQNSTCHFLTTIPKPPTDHKQVVHARWESTCSMTTNGWFSDLFQLLLWDTPGTISGWFIKWIGDAGLCHVYISIYYIYSLKIFKVGLGHVPGGSCHNLVQTWFQLMNGDLNIHRHDEIAIDARRKSLASCCARRASLHPKPKIWLEYEISSTSQSWESLSRPGMKLPA